jgi:hypothetical protein
MICSPRGGRHQLEINTARGRLTTARLAFLAGGFRRRGSQDNPDRSECVLGHLRNGCLADRGQPHWSKSSTGNMSHATSGVHA